MNAKILVFGFNEYEASGGSGDLVGTSQTAQEAVDHIRILRDKKKKGSKDFILLYQEYHILDMRVGVWYRLNRFYDYEKVEKYNPYKKLEW
jgi:hypothetical protein